jgi:glycyl-tRNA synthetase beta chain
LVLGNGVRVGFNNGINLHYQSLRKDNRLFTGGIMDLLLQEQAKSYGVEMSSPSFEDDLKNAVTHDLLSFFHDRLKVFLKDQGIRPDIIEACLAMPLSDDLTLLVNRARALAAFLQTDDGTNLLQGVKRAANILTQAETKDGVEYSFGADIKFAETDSERALFAALDTAEAAITPAMAAEDFAAAMTAMAALRAPIDAFFTDVQVNADSAILRRNRLNLLHRIRALCAGVADFAKLDG